MERKTKYRIQYFISLAVSLTLLLLVFRNVDFSRILPPLVSIHWPVLILLLFLSPLSNLGFYCHRWQYMLKWLGYHHSLWEIIRVHLGTGVLHLFMPVQTGEAVTTVALARKGKGPLALYFGTIAYGKYVNLIATILHFLVGLAVSKDTPIPRIGTALFAFAGIMIAGLLLEIRPIREGLVRIAGRFGKKAGPMLRDLFSVFADYSLSKKLFLLGYSLLFQFSEVLVCFILFRHMGIGISFASHLAVCSLIILVSSLPVTIAGAGTREALCLLLLTHYTDPATAVAAGLLYTFIEYVWPMIIGLPWMRPVISEYLLNGKTNT